MAARESSSTSSERLATDVDVLPSRNSGGTHGGGQCFRAGESDHANPPRRLSTQHLAPKSGSLVHNLQRHAMAQHTCASRKSGGNHPSLGHLTTPALSGSCPIPRRSAATRRTMSRIAMETDSH